MAGLIVTRRILLSPPLLESIVSRRVLSLPKVTCSPRSPEELPAFIEFAKSLRPRDVYDVVSCAVP